MYPLRAVFLTLIFQSFSLFVLCNRNDLNQCFEEINTDMTKLNRIAAEIAWESSIHPGNPELPAKATVYQKRRIAWQHRKCDKLTTLKNGHSLNDTQRRQAYLLCRGPIYTFDEARETSTLYEDLQSTYADAKVCIPINRIIMKENLTEVENIILDYLQSVKVYINSEHKENDVIEAAVKLADSYKNENNNNLVFCIKGESEFEKLMSFSRNEKVLRWLWLVWREKLGPSMINPYKRLVQIENIASRRNGYSDIGAAWRDELEIPGLRQYCRNLYESIRPLYKILHGVVRFYLRKHYGDLVPEKGPIPAHLLGNLWAQNWEPLADLITQTDINIDKSILNMNWTVEHMVKRAEDFYQSLGLPPMTKTFWRESVFAKQNNEATRCHGTAADMFSYDDYRLLYCAGTSSEDFYVIHHEMGHIHYYMAYENQPGIFRQGANSAFHESIGDAIMYGVITPQHLYRLGLINDTILYSASQNTDNLNDYEDSPEDKTPNNNIRETTEQKEGKNSKNNAFKDPDDVLLLKQALNKIPQIPFSLLIDEYRWKFFEGKIEENSYNKEFWNMALELQGIAPPDERGEEYFDVGAKFHVPDNTPYIRYFLSSFLQHQLFEALCKAAVFGRRNVAEDIPHSIPINRCDIYGSKAVGKILKDIMSRGSSQHWREILLATTGEDEITSTSLKRYYAPLYKLLNRLVRAHRIPIGWE